MFDYNRFLSILLKNLLTSDFTPALNHHEIPQQGPGVAPTPPSVPVQQQQQQQSKEFNTASLCRLGQETVQDIVSRTQEVFQTLKTIQVMFFNFML